MNDRVSAKPPSVFIRHDEDMEQYVAELLEASPVKSPSKGPYGSHGNLGDFADPSISMADLDKGLSRRSGLLRFGKAIATALNPLNLWSDHKTSKQSSDDRTPQPNLTNERKERVEKIYMEMKRDGRLSKMGMIPHTTQHTRTLVAKGPTAAELSLSAQGPAAGPCFHSSLDETETVKHAPDHEKPLPQPPKFTEHGLVEDAIAGRSARRRASFNFKSPSLTNLKKTRSDIHLAGSESRSTSRDPDVISDILTVEASQVVKKQISRKDLQKQQKLSKRVSNLESKLDLARRELIEVVGEPSYSHPQPNKTFSRKPFTPGALPSLPSESLLAPQSQAYDLVSEHGRLSESIPSNGNIDIHCFRTEANSVEQTISELPANQEFTTGDSKNGQNPENGNAPNVEERTAQPQPVNLIAQELAADIPLNHDTKRAKMGTAKKQTTPRKRKMEAEEKNDLGRLTEDEDDGGRDTVISPIAKRTRRRVQSESGGAHSRLKPPGASIDSGQGEDSTTRRIESISRVGQAPLPSAPEKSTTNVRSVKHHNKPAPVFLGRPRSTSPTKARRVSDRSISPPPSLSYSKPSTRQSSFSESPAPGKPGPGHMPPVPNKSIGMNRIVRLASGEVDPTASDIAAEEKVHRLSNEVSSVGLRMEDAGSMAARTDVKPAEQVTGMNDKFEWPDDVF